MDEFDTFGIDEFDTFGIDDFDTLFFTNQYIINKRKLHNKQKYIIKTFYKNISNFNFNNIDIKFITINISNSEFIISDIEYNKLTYIFKYFLDINCSDIIMSYLAVNIFDIIKLDDKMSSEFNDILHNIIYDFIGINYYIKDNIYTFIPYDIFTNII